MHIYRMILIEYTYTRKLKHCSLIAYVIKLCSINGVKHLFVYCITILWSNSDIIAHAPMQMNPITHIQTLFIYTLCLHFRELFRHIPKTYCQPYIYICTVQWLYRISIFRIFVSIYHSYNHFTLLYSSIIYNVYLIYKQQLYKVICIMYICVQYKRWVNT